MNKPGYSVKSDFQSYLQKNMNRKEFLQTLGLGAVTIAFIESLPGCQKSDLTPANVDFTINTTDTQYNALNQAGGYVYVNNVIIANNDGQYLALSKICTHAGCTVVYESQQNNFYCPCHGSIFNFNGQVIMGPASYPLTQYTVDVNGTSLHVHN